MKSELKIQKLKKKDIKIAKKFTSNLVGEGIYTKSTIKKAIKSKKHHFQILKLNGECVGYHYYAFAKQKDIPKILGNTKPSTAFESCQSDEKLAIFCSIGILPEYRNRGISDFAITEAISHAKSENCTMLVAYAWQKGNKAPAENPLKRHGFQLFETVENAWQDIENLKCTVCGKEKCECTAKIFTKRIEK
ncbi:MAG: GNAT family N-acetyltransferase [Bacillota bacterium]